MSDDWKNDRAEASMREFDKENMTKAAQKRKEQEIHGEWTIKITTSGEDSKSKMNSMIDKLLILSNKKDIHILVEIDPIIKTEK